MQNSFVLMEKNFFSIQNRIKNKTYFAFSFSNLDHLPGIFLINGIIFYIVNKNGKHLIKLKL